MAPLINGFNFMDEEKYRWKRYELVSTSSYGSKFVKDISISSSTGTASSDNLDLYFPNDFDFLTESKIKLKDPISVSKKSYSNILSLPSTIDGGSSIYSNIVFMRSKSDFKSMNLPYISDYGYCFVRFSGAVTNIAKRMQYTSIFFRIDKAKLYKVIDVINYSKGSYIDDVYSTNRNAYPDNYYSGSYWYVFDGVV